ncbi:hypothetical protein Tco_1577855 [Tanacetum coccineum]
MILNWMMTLYAIISLITFLFRVTGHLSATCLMRNFLISSALVLLVKPREEVIQRKDREIADLKSCLEKLERDFTKDVGLRGYVLELDSVATVKVEELVWVGAAMKLDDRLASLDIDMDMELFPYTLTVVAEIGEGILCMLAKLEFGTVWTVGRGGLGGLLEQYDW